MSNPTTPFSWQMPTATDLVTDLPADFEVFGQAVATSMADLLGGPSGYILSKASATDMDFTWIANDQGDITGITAGTGITVTSPTGPVPTVTFDQANFGGGQFSAGKNKVINGDFSIWQRGTSFTNPAGGTGVYLCDRIRLFYGGTGATRTISQQTFTPGTAPVSGYEGQFFFRYDQSVAGTGDTFNQISNVIEGVRTFAGQTITLSFWAKAAASTTLGQVSINQNFGSGGSTTVNTAFGTPTITTSWTRYSYTVTLPSISGKTIGANNFIEIRFLLPNNATFTLDLWGLQLEAGSTATPFQTASGGSYQGELAMCQRYYQRITPATAGASFSGFAATTSQALFSVPFAQTMRTAPTALEQTGTVTDYAIRSTAGNTNCNVVPTFISASTAFIVVDAQVAATLTAGQGVLLRFNNAGVTYLGWSAEL